jgi:ribose-phosphate pyrophosphokinase
MVIAEGQATLEEAVRRAVITLKSGNTFADAIRKSHFLNYYDRNNQSGVLPIGDDLLEFRQFSSGEYAVTLLPEEIKGNGRETNQHFYVDDRGERVRFFNDEEGNELTGKTVYVVASPSIDADWQPDQTVFRMQIAMRTAKHMGAERAYAVFSEFPFARQDRGIKLYNRAKDGSTDADKKKHAGQTDYVSTVLLGLMVHGCDGVVTLHHHSGHVQEAARDCLGVLGRDRETQYVFDLSPTPLIARYLQETDVISNDERRNDGEGIVFIAPDEGALEFVRSVKEMTGYRNAGLVHIDKKRLRANDEGAIRGILVGDKENNYDGKVGIVLDDMVDTFGTMNLALNKLPSEIQRVVMYATHGIFAGHAEDLLRKHKRVSDVIVMDTRQSRLRHLGAGPKRKLTVLQPAQYFAHALAHCVEQGRNPVAFYQEVFQVNPAFFSGLYKVKRFDQHYSKQ